MEYIRVTKDNLEKEHICCAISNNKDIQVSSKKAWLADRFDEGLVFLKSVERGKCFIEYIPAENAWVPIDANGFMYIDCLWVSGSFKGHGYSTDLLDACITDSKEKGMKGLCILASAKKKPFLADPKFLKYKGFKVADEADNGIQLWYLPFEESAGEQGASGVSQRTCLRDAVCAEPKASRTTCPAGADAPAFKDCAKHPRIDEKGYVLYYTSQCPFNAKYVPILEKTAEENGIPFHAVHIESRKDAQNAPTPVTNYALFHDGEYVTNEQMNDRKFLKLVGR
ncbi:MAG: YoaP domain-containing protein [Lachnospiraceae bacterium]|nr:YoaP domain-containing protein [Lachnospiraceae bacterium]